MKKSFKMKSKRKPAALAALLLAAAISTPVSAHEPEVKPLTMAVINNEAHGAKVNSGKYEQAIDRITRNGRRSPDSFAEQVNLCVAYTKIKEIEKASIACDAAIARAQKLRSYLRGDADLALALSNRGVLMAAKGNHELARQDFLTAINLETKLTSIALNNLKRVDKQIAS